MSLTIDDLVVKSTYNFEVHPAVLLGSNFQGCTILSIMDAETARIFTDIDGLHAKIYPYLPSGSPNDPNAYNYAKVRTSSGHSTVIGLLWINESTIELVERINVSVSVADVLTSDVSKIRDILIQNGYSNVAVTIS